MRHLCSIAILIGAVSAAHAQSANSGSNNGNNNSGSLNGNLNGNFNGTVGSSTSSVTVTRKANTPGVFAPGLTAAGVESCLGSASVGGAGAGFGVTVGGTYADKDCNLRLYARSLYAMGHRVAALQLLCKDPDVAEALAVEGVQCIVPPTQPEYQASVGPTNQIDTPDCSHYDIFTGCHKN